MNITIAIMTIVLIITIFSPFGVYYGVKLARNGNYKTHRKIQNIIFTVCVIGVLALEGLINTSGGSGSLSSKSIYYHTIFFKFTLFSHIIVAIVSYIIWTILIVFSNLSYQKKLPGKYSKLHKKTGYVIFGGLIYTAITALLVYLMSLNLV